MKFRLISQLVLATTIAIPHLYFLPSSAKANDMCKTIGERLDPFKQCSHIHFVGGKIKPTAARVDEREKKNAYFIKRIGEHTEWLLTNGGRADLWNDIKSSAQRDAGNTSSDYYRLRIAEHAEYLLPRSSLTNEWNQIFNSAARDAKI